MPSQQDVAKLAKVSFMTVSRVINNNPNVTKATRERVLKAIKELSYYPNAAARALNSNKSRNVGIIFPRKDYFFVAPFCMELCFEVESRLKPKGYNLFLGSMTKGSESRELTAMFREGKVDGLILFAPRIGEEEIKMLADDHMPFVVVHGRSAGKEFSYVDSDNAKGTSLILRYLFDLGHRRIGFVSGDIGEMNSMDRYRRYRRELKAKGLPFDKRLVFFGDWSLESGHAAFRYLIEQKERPTAIFFSNDQMAIGAIKAAEELGVRIPDDVSITGYDDIKYASFTVPALTTVRQNIGAVGDKVAELILDTIEGKGEFRKIILEPELVVRSSCCRPVD
jgi:DNA-binding LacI/PurR family transcriptional regulator